MNYEEARAYLEKISKYGSVLGLENIRWLLKRLGNPQKELRFVHISGTNGKGSVLAYLSSVLSCAGYRTGRYLSPTLFSYRERIQVDGAYIEREALAAYVTRIAAAMEERKETQEPLPTIFEVETALAFLYFRDRRCDFVVLETGMGGALDATNIIDTSVLEVITPIGMDHMEFLGDTLEKIARQKAGIIKPHTAVVCAKQEQEAYEVLVRTCEEKHCSLQAAEPEKITDVQYGIERQRFSYKQWKDMEISLAGSYQMENAALALEAVCALQGLGYSLPVQAVQKGMREAVWRGRFTLISQKPRILLDGAHNPAAARRLRESLELYFQGRSLFYIFGIFRDKDYEKVIALTAPLAKKILTIQTPGNERALPAEELREAVSKVNPAVEAAKSIEEAVVKSLEEMDEEDVLVIFGSLSFLGEAERAVQKALQS